MGGDSDDPTEVCDAWWARSWHVVCDASAPTSLTLDPRIEIRGLSDADFAEVQRSWRQSLSAAANRVAAAEDCLEVTGFPGALAVLNGVLEKRPSPWNRHPAWQRIGKPEDAAVYLYRDALGTKWVLGFSLGDGGNRAAHVYTSLESPAGGLVWEVDCGDSWRAFLTATVRSVPAERLRICDREKRSAGK